MSQLMGGPAGAAPAAPAAPPVDQGGQPPVDPGQPPSEPVSILNDSGEFNEGWYQGNQELEQFSDQLSKFKNPAAMAKSYALLERNRAVPGADAEPEVITAFRKTNGIPETASGYELKAPENLPEGIVFKPELMEPYKEVFHQMNLTPAQAQSLMEAHLQQTSQMVQVEQQQMLEAHEKHVGELRNQWGTKFDANLEAADNTLKSLAQKAGVQLDSISPEILNDPTVVKLLHAASSLTAESGSPAGGHAEPIGMNGGGNKQKAVDIQTNPNNPDYKAYYDPSDPPAQQHKGKCKVYA